MGINPSSLEHFVKIAEIIPCNKKVIKVYITTATFQTVCVEQEDKSIKKLPSNT